MKARQWSIAGFAAIALIFGGTPKDAQEPTAHAYSGNGFTPAQNYPHRDTTYDEYLPAAPGLDQYTFSTLYNHVAFPQSRSALTGLLGWPVAYDGNFDYYRIDGTGNEVAIYYSGDTALFFTVGY